MTGPMTVSTIPRAPPSALSSVPRSKRGLNPGAFSPVTFNNAF